MRITVRPLVAGAMLMAAIAALSTTAQAAPVGILASGGSVAGASTPGGVEPIRYRRGRGIGYGIGAGILGGVIAGTLLAPRYYGPSYYGPSYSRRYYAEPPVVYDEPGDDDIEYCLRRFRSYDPRSGTYLGYDGYRHPCP